MALICPQCGKQYDSSLFAFGKKISCSCGCSFGIGESNIINTAEISNFAREKELKRYQKLQRMCDGICLIISTGMVPEKKVDRLIARARAYCEEFFPGKSELFDMIYGSRFEQMKQKKRNNHG